MKEPILIQEEESVLAHEKKEQNKNRESNKVEEALEAVVELPEITMNEV